MRKALVILSLAVLFSSCKMNNDRFRLLSSEDTGIEFNNRITETDSFNILTYEYIYNGGGVAIGDFDNNGWQDIYFTGNMVSNQLYLNAGDLKFKNVTGESGTAGDEKWCSGVAVVDINADGWQDIYICATAHPDPALRKNILYINQGLNKEGVPTFIDQAELFHLDDTSHATVAAFFDYDRDGDQDLFVAVNKMTNGKTPNVYKTTEGFTDRIDKLFRNDWDSVERHPVFTDVTREAGINHDGYSLGLNVTDINQDGWPDIFVTNDYLTNDLVYINKRDGTFENKAAEFFKHTSYSAMGNDVVDINNDGLPDVITVDMLPEDNYRRKTMLGPNNYSTYINNEKYGLQYQYIRNTLQLNQGRDPGTGTPLFSDVSFLSGISSTDWSWTPLVADFDNDGYRDIIITNGFPKDVTDRDYVEYYSQAGNYASKSFLMQFMPSVKIKNYAYRNTGGFVFENVSESWGITTPSFSNGAAYADLDNDGDLDYVVNNINDKAFLFENLTDKHKEVNHNWLRIKLIGPGLNSIGLGTKVKLYVDGRILFSDHTTYRGYLSTMEPYLHFGLGSAQVIDSIHVEWLNGSISKIENVKVNQVISVTMADKTKEQEAIVSVDSVKLFKDVSSIFSGYEHEEEDFIDFNIQPLLFHKLSQYGPGIAVGDVDGNGLDDFYVGGSHGHEGSFFIQKREGHFERSSLIEESPSMNRKREELGVLFFDADHDGDLDLFSASGGFEYDLSDSCYRHSFYENIGGKFRLREDALPDFRSSASCVRASDVDRDGDLDLFIGGRVHPQQYPKAASSYLLRNDSQPGKIKFTEFPQRTGFNFLDFGLVCDALWTDFDQDGWVDLIVAGEWMPIRFLKNNHGELMDVGSTTGISQWKGWWNSISSADFDNDGDMDYVVGNLGLNTLIKASEAQPVSLYSDDFDGNGTVDIMPTAYFKDVRGNKKEYPFFGRLDIQKELIKVKRSFLKHADFGTATIDMVFTPEQLNAAHVYKANYFQSAYIENKGSGKFEISPLPMEAQLAPVYGMFSDDINNDHNADIVCVGNDFGTEVSMGRYDALNGLVLLGDGSGNFTHVPLQTSGLCVKGDAKGLATLLNPSGDYFILATQNRNILRAFQQKTLPERILSIDPDIASVEIVLKDGFRIRKEIYYGSGFLSQSSRRIRIPENVDTITFTTFSGTQKQMTNF